MSKRDCKACAGSGLVTGHYRKDCRNPWCKDPMHVACPVCSGVPFVTQYHFNFVGACSPKQEQGND